MESINLSKFLVPTKQKGFLHRARLIDWMHENIHRKLTFISAPAGFGKTSLMLDFASDVDARVCWLLITQGDTDIRRLAWDLVLSFRQSFPHFGAEIEAYLKTNQGRVDPLSLAVDFTNEIIRSIDDFCLLFIDDYHLVAESEEATGFLEQLLDYLPDGVRVILASRTEFGIPTGKLYARNQINLLNVDQLRFRPEELQQLVGRAFRLKLSDHEAQELARRSDGWIVAAMLAANSLKSGMSLDFQGSTDHVYAFLAQDVIAREAPQLQNFMLAISVVDEFGVDLANRLIDSGPADNLVRELERRNLFVSRVETTAGPAYRFHQLFLEFLRHRLAAAHPRWKQDLHRRAAGWYEDNKDWDHAIQHYLDVDDRASAARLMDYSAKHYFVFGENQRVERWLSVLSQTPDMRAASPELVLNRAKYLVDQNQLTEAEQLLEIAESVFETSGNTDQILNGLSVRGVIHLRRGQYEEALGVVRRAEEILSGEIRGDLYIARRHQFMRIRSFYHLWQGETATGSAFLAEVIQELRTLLLDIENPVVRVQVTHDLVISLDQMGWVHYQQGQLYESLRYYLEALEYREKTLRNNQGLLYSLNSIGYIYFQLGDFGRAYEFLKRGLQVAETTEKGQATIHLHNSLSDLLREVDDWEGAEANIRLALSIGRERAAVRRKSFRRSQLDNSGTYLVYAELERVRGNFDKAIYYLHEAYRLREQAPEVPDFFARLGAVYFSMGQLDLAIETLRKALDGSVNPANASQAKALAAYLLGCAHYQKGMVPESLYFLNSALSMIALMGYDQFIISEGRRTRAFLESVAERMASGQVKSVLKRVGRFQPGLEQFELEQKEESDAQAKIRLEVYGFGVGRIVLNGESLSRSNWRANMAKALFFYLVDGHGDSGAAIKLAFWPDKPGPKATSNFQSTLWRARNALKGLNVIVLESNRYQLSQEVVLWYDVSEFENRLQQARDPSLSPAASIDLLGSAIELYEGDFLEDVFMDWSDQRRLELQRLYLEALLSLGDLLFKRERFDEARSHYDRLITVDPYRDDVLMAIMRCHVHCGAPQLALQRYRQHAEFLRSEGMEPAGELDEYYRRLSTA